MFFFFFFFKQKTAYEMRISDWSSDVCSSDLILPIASRRTAVALHRNVAAEDPEDTMRDGACDDRGRGASAFHKFRSSDHRWRSPDGAPGYLSRKAGRCGP